MSRLPRLPLLPLALLGVVLAAPAHAQVMAYDSAGDAAKGGDVDAGTSGGKAGQGGRKVSLTPYIEAAQVATAELSPGHDVLTYTSIAVGLDANVQGHNTHAAASVRYERRIGYGKSSDGDTISGVVRVATALVPHAVNFEVGALAARTRVEDNGSAVLGASTSTTSTSQIWSAFAGPTVHTHAGNVAVDGGYRIGYTKVGTSDAFVRTPGGPPADLFDHSVVQDAEVHAGTKAGTVLPVGIGAGAGFFQEDVSNLDQRVRDFHARLDATLPAAIDVQLVGGVGYEDVEISSRDALRDSSGNPVIGANGRYVTDSSGPRIMAYDTSGLIWDAGVMWRPSRRTSLEAYIGRRYGSTSVWGSFTYAPNSRSSVSISVFDNVAGFGGQLNKALAGLPTDFEASYNPLTGALNGCVVTLEKGGCLNGALGSLRSATFRARGVTATYGIDFGKVQAGIGAGYTRRTFIAAPGTVLASANGVVDENTWLTGYVNLRLDSRSHLSTNAFIDWYKSGFVLADDTSAVGVSTTYGRMISSHLTATAALGLDGISRQSQPDTWDASALLGLRYTF